MKSSRSSNDSDQTSDDSTVEFDDLEPVMIDEGEFDDLEVMSADGVDELEEWTEDDDCVEVKVGEASEQEFDLRFELSLGSLEKSQILSAARAPLVRALADASAEVRWRRVVVSISGEAMIPSAIKDLLAEVFADAKPLSVTVQRGYPDELVFEGEAPSVKVSRSVVEASEGTPGHLYIEVTTAQLGESDLPMAMAGELGDLCRHASGKSFAFRFCDGPTPEPAVYCTPLIEAGASRVLLASAGGHHVLFDRELEGLVTVSTSGGCSTFDVAGGHDVVTTLRACSLVFTQNAQHITAADVTVNFAPEFSSSEAVETLLGFAKDLRPTSLALGNGDCLWPPVVQSAVQGKRTGLRIGGPVRDDFAQVLQRELGDIAIEGQDVTFDWPAGSNPDQAAAQILRQARPASLVYTVGGEGAELVYPVAVAFRREGGVTVCDIQTAVGKPAELVPAIARHMKAESVAGQKVDICVLGGGMVTRTMRATMIEVLQGGGAAQARLIEGDAVEFLFPDLLTFENLDDDQLRITVAIGDRTPEEVASALVDGLQEQGITSGTTVRVSDGSIAGALVESGVERVVVEGDPDVQVYPALFRPVSKGGDQVLVQALPDAEDLQAQLDREFDGMLADLGHLTEAAVTLSWAGDSDARADALARILAAGPAALSLEDNGVVRQIYPEIARSYVDVLGERSSGDVPMLMLGIDIDDLEGATSALSERQAQLEGRRVLVVYRAEGRDVAGPVDNDVVQATRATLDAAAKVVLQYRPPTRAGAAHFEVVKSDLEGLVLGSRMKDPRAATGN